MKQFPTIKQMIDAIIFAMNGCNGKCEYHQDTYTFIAVEYVPYPVRDSGGSIDAIGFEEVIHEIPFQEGYQYWQAFIDFVEGRCSPIPAPVCPHYRYPEFEEDDLPF